MTTITHSVHFVARKSGLLPMNIHRLIQMKIIKCTYDSKLKQIMITDAEFKRFMEARRKGVYRDVSKPPPPPNK